MTVRVKRSDGTLSDPIGVNVAPNERLNINGKPTAIQDVASGQELTAYINVTDPGIAPAQSDEAAPSRVHAGAGDAGAGAQRRWQPRRKCRRLRRRFRSSLRSASVLLAFGAGYRVPAAPQPGLRRFVDE
jgi:hypothetical protein